MASKAELENKLRSEMLNHIINLVNDVYDTDALSVSASELAIPRLDEEGNEKWVLVKVSIPRGTRNGEGGYDPYDGYTAAADYAEAIASKTQERAARKAMKEAEKGKRKTKKEEEE